MLRFEVVKSAGAIKSIWNDFFFIHLRRLINPFNTIATMARVVYKYSKKMYKMFAIVYFRQTDFQAIKPISCSLIAKNRRSFVATFSAYSSTPPGDVWKSPAIINQQMP